ncbi:A1 cistron-splicing factor, AAR2 [Lasallia pustulata]|uniref:A1 cistron-splicing factor, AAR2 n=1 Tax=Lasallia pustulata TaxID=136370 RepID=A0A1W5CXR8_9LECA|nr:A1 cistron-splicing factor, AAR2 [Lasallia pustulata]
MTTPAILLLDLPPTTLCGIDLLSFTTSPRFRGIKDLPPGFHFVFTGATPSLSIRHGFWFHIPAHSHPAPLLVRKWDASREELVPETDDAALLRWRANLGALWKEGLAPYRQSAAPATGGQGAGDGHGGEGELGGEVRDWGGLTSHVTPALLSRITGGSDDAHWTLTSASCAKQDRDEIPGLSGEESVLVEEKELGFLKVDLTRTWREGAVGRERTEGAMDRSWALEEVVRGSGNGRGGEWGGEVVGEMQVCFLMVLALANYSCMEQWKRILGLVFTCKRAVVEKEGWFAGVVALLRTQLKRCEDVEGGLFDFSDEGGTLLKRLLKAFKRTLDEVFENADDGMKVKEEVEELEAFVKAEYGWNLSDSYVRRGMLELEDGERVEMEMNELEGEDERGEYAPVIVELD